LKAALAQSEKAQCQCFAVRKTTNGRRQTSFFEFRYCKKQHRAIKNFCRFQTKRNSAGAKSGNTAEANFGNSSIGNSFRRSQVLEQTKALVISAQTKLEIARDDLERAQQLFSKGDISKQGFDRERRIQRRASRLFPRKSKWILHRAR
jgi:hypothetical protein